MWEIPQLCFNQLEDKKLQQNQSSAKDNNSRNNKVLFILIINDVIRNYQKTCVFIQLNIGYMGIVVDEKNINSLKKLFTLGDIILFQITE